MPFNPITEHPTLRLPILGKTYRVESPDAATGLWIQSIMSAAAFVRSGATPTDADVQTVLDDDDERDMYARVLGDTHAQLVADGVPWHTIKRAGTTAVMWVAYGEETAERFWNGESADPKAPTPETSSSASAAPPA